MNLTFNKLSLQTPPCLDCLDCLSIFIGALSIGPAEHTLELDIGVETGSLIWHSRQDFVLEG